MGRAIEQEIRARAQDSCEYCRLPEKLSKLKFVFDHVIAPQHGGEDTLDNLALACGFCNRHKEPNVAGIDPATLQMTLSSSHDTPALTGDPRKCEANESVP
jgi:5-methylcytosine-specific restriction endonuclease McrA